MIGSKLTNGLQELPATVTSTYQEYISEATDAVEEFQWGPIISYYCIYIGIIFILVSIPANTFRPIDTAIAKIKVVRDNMDRVFSSKQIDYGEISERQGQNVTSGLWRLYFWHRIWGRFWDSSVDRILFGYDVGTVPPTFGNRPHNDYWRLLYETGLFGFILFMIIWVVIYRKMDTKYRWAVIMIAVYCISENNYDHFPAMSLLALYMLGAKKWSYQGKSPTTLNPRE